MEQKKVFKKWIGTSRYVYNRALHATKQGEKMNFYQLRNKYVIAKNNPLVKEWETETPKDIRAEAINDMTKAFKSAISNLKNNNIQKFNQNGELINKSILEQTEIKNKELIYDYFYDAIYVYGLNKGTKEIYKLNIDDGKIVLAGNINQIDPSHIKVVGKEIFFLSRNEAGFNKLFRMKME